MKIDYLYRHKEFKKVLEKELDRLIEGKINQIRIKNIPSDIFCEANLKKLRRDSKEVVENMRVKEQLNDVYDSMDDLKNTTATDKLLASIKEKNEDLDASVAGARVVHENKTSTKVQRVNEKAKKIENDEYLESLKKKYNRK